MKQKLAAIFSRINANLLWPGRHHSRTEPPRAGTVKTRPMQPPPQPLVLGISWRLRSSSLQTRHGRTGPVYVRKVIVCGQYRYPRCREYCRVWTIWHVLARARRAAFMCVRFVFTLPRTFQAPTFTGGVREKRSLLRERRCLDARQPESRVDLPKVLGPRRS